MFSDYRSLLLSQELVNLVMEMRFDGVDCELDKVAVLRRRVRTPLPIAPPRPPLAFVLVIRDINQRLQIPFQVSKHDSNRALFPWIVA